MAEVTQYTFSWSEVAEQLIKKQGIHEGQWIATVEFTINAGFVGLGPNPADTRPGMMVTAGSVQLAKAQPNAPAHFIVDAAKVNPAKASPAK
jgi:hypothetical protein